MQHMLRTALPSEQSTVMMGVVGSNLAHPTFLGTLPSLEALKIQAPNAEVISSNMELGAVIGGFPIQRPLDWNQVKSASDYILMAGINAVQVDEDAHPDEITFATNLKLALGDARTRHNLPPIVVASLATDDDSVSDMAHVGQGIYSLSVKPKKLMVLDGQHRLGGFKLAMNEVSQINREQAYSKSSKLLIDKARKDLRLSPVESKFFERLENTLKNFTFQIELHVGVSVQEARQIFSDHNSLARKVSAAISADFDSANPLNNFSKGLPDSVGLRLDLNKSAIGFDAADQGLTALKEVNTINGLLFTNKPNVRNAKLGQVTKQKDNALRFWKAVQASPNFGSDRAKDKTLLAQPVMLQALAKLSYDLTVGKYADDEAFSKLLDGISNDTINFSHDNYMFRYYSLSEQDRQKYGIVGLVDYLPHFEDNVAREVGSADANGLWHFSTRHNDIRPILGDMIRWKLGLSPRERKAPKKV